MKEHLNVIFYSRHPHVYMYYRVWVCIYKGIIIGVREDTKKRNSQTWDGERGRREEELPFELKTQGGFTKCVPLCGRRPYARSRR